MILTLAQVRTFRCIVRLLSVVLVAGLVVLAYPFDSIVTLALVVGIWLIVLGGLEVISGFGMRSDVKKVHKVTDAVLAG